MDSFQLNKILGAILGTLLFVMGCGFLAEAIYNPITGGAGYVLPEAAEAAEGGEAPAEPVDIGTLLAAADPVEGASQAKKCLACHDVTAGGPNKTGPNLYDVVERVIGSHAGYAYSDAMLAHQANGDTWTYQFLNEFLLAPKAAVPGTKMTFAGVKNDEERANIIAYLSTLSASPKPFPAPAAPPEAATEVGAPPAEQVVEGSSSTEAIETPTDASAPVNAPGGSGTTNTEVAPAAPTAAPAAAPEAAAPASAAPAAPPASSSIAP